MASNQVLNIEVRAAVASAVEELQQLGYALGGNVGAKAQELSEKLSRLAAHSDAITFFREMQQQAAQAEQNYRKLSAELVEYERQLGKSTEPQHVARIQQLRQEVGEAANQWDRSRQQLSVATRQMYEFGTSAGNAQKAQERLRREMAASTDKALAMVQRMRDMVSGVRGWESAARGVANSVTGAFRQIHEAIMHVPGAIKSVSDKFGQLYNVLAAQVSFSALTDAASKMQSVRVALQAVTGSAEEAGRQFDFVKRVANSAGTDIAESAQHWMKLSAAAKGTALEGAAAQGVFEAVTNAMASMGRSSGETGAVLRTLTQIINGEEVSARQLERTLGTQLPGALQAAAKGFGVTEAELRKMLDSGEITAEKLLPALTKGLNETVNAVPAVAKVEDAFQRLKNSFSTFADEWGQSGGIAVLVEGAEIVSAAILKVTDNVIRGGQLVGATISGLVNRDFSNYKQAIIDITEESNQRLAKMAQGNEYLRKSIEVIGSAGQQAALANADAAAKTAESGKAAATAAPQLAALGMGYKDLEKEIASVKDASKLEIEVIQERIKAAEADARQEGLAADAKLAAQEKLAQARKAESEYYTRISAQKQEALQKAQAELAAMEKAAASSEEEAKRRAPVIENLKTLVLMREKDARAATAQARAHSETARAASDELEAVRSKVQVQETEAQTSLTLLQAQKEMAQQGEALARQMGNEYEARQYRIEQLEIEVKITHAKAEAARIEAQGSIDVARAQMEELRVKGQLTEAKKAELQASINLAEAKLKEAAAIGQSAELQRRAIDTMRTYSSVTGAVSEHSSRATARAAEGWREVAYEADNARNAVDGYADSVRNAPQPPSGNGGNGGGNGGNRNASSTAQTWMSVMNMAQQMGADEEQARQIADMMFDANGSFKMDLHNAVKRGNKDYFGKSEAVRRAVEMLMRGQDVGGIKAVKPEKSTSKGAGAGDGVSRTESRSQAQASGSTVNININGKRTSIGVANDADAHNLERLLREIANDAGRAA